MTVDVLVVGAGPAGINAAYYLERVGISYRVVDKASITASTWASLYPTLRLNTAGFISHLPGKQMPLRDAIFPTGKRYYAYVQNYLKDHHFNIDLGVEVKRITPEGEGWRVETDQGVEWYRVVIVASGRFNKPYLPAIPGVEDFEGEYLHASAYRDPASFAGKRVLVVGNGPSGGDISADLAGQSDGRFPQRDPVAAMPVLLGIRSDIVVAKEYPYGIPTTVWGLMSLWLPKRWRMPFLHRVLYQGYRGQDKLGLPLAPNREDRVGTSAPVRGRGLVDGIRAGRIRPVAGLARLTRDSAVLLDGTTHPVDAVIMCTGYRPAIDYLDFPFEVDKDGWMVRRSEDSQQAAGYPGLYVIGRFYRGLGPLYNMRQEAEVAIREIAECLTT